MGIKIFFYLLLLFVLMAHTCGMVISKSYFCSLKKESDVKCANSTYFIFSTFIRSFIEHRVLIRDPTN
jgi:hypothetical protein